MRFTTPSVPEGGFRVYDLDKLRVDSPARPLDWRWQRVKLICGGGRALSRRWDDEHIVRAVDFKREYDKCVDEWELYELRKSYADLHEAFRLYEAADTYSFVARAELEARLLCNNADIALIAKLSGLSPRVVRTYDALFFNVRDRIDDPDYLRRIALGDRMQRGIKEDEYEIIWRFFALLNGIWMVQNMIWLAHREILASPALSSRFKRQLSRELINSRSLLSCVSLKSADPLVKLQLMELNARYVEMEKDLEADAGLGDKTMDGFARGLAGVRICVRQAAKAGIPFLSPGGVEPRAEQKLLAALGAPVTLSERAAQASFPTAKADDKL